MNKLLTSSAVASCGLLVFKFFNNILSCLDIASKLIYTPTPQSGRNRKKVVEASGRLPHRAKETEKKW